MCLLPKKENHWFAMAAASSLFAGFRGQKKEVKVQEKEKEKKVEAPQPPQPPRAPTTVLDTLHKQGLVKLPERAGWSDYTGKFWSTKYNKALSRGNVYVQLPDAMKPAEPVTVDAQVQYKGMYRLNSVEHFPIVMRDQNQAETQDFETKPTKVQGIDAPHGKGTLEFQVEKREGDKITGTYKLSHPRDRGRFELQKGMTHGESCMIM